MFYEKFIELCVQRGIAPTKAAIEAGLTAGSVTGWKKGSPPRSSAVQKVASYFDVPVEYFDGEPTAGTEKAPALETNTEAKYMMELFTQLEGDRRKQAVAYLLELSRGTPEAKK